MRLCSFTWMACLAASGGAMAGADAPDPIRVTVQLGRSLGKVSPHLFGCALPAPGTPGAEALLPELLRNRSFEKGALAGPKPMPEAWSKSHGWQLFAFGGHHMIVRSNRERRDPLVLIGRRNWEAYRLSVRARKIDGPDGLAVLFDVQDRRNHLRWTLGANGNSQHVLESVGGGAPRLLAPPMPGRIETGRCYRIDVSLRRGVLQCSLDGRLVHQVAGTRFPHAGFGLGATDSTAEFFDLGVYAPKEAPIFLLDNPAALANDTLASDWTRLASEGSKVGFTWDPVYPFNSHFSQGIRVDVYAGGDVGLCQGGIPIAAGETYRGRVHLRGTGQAPLAVSLRSAAGKVYATHTLGELAGTWSAHDFVLKPSESDPQACFCFTVGGRAAVWVDQASLAAEGLRSPWGLRSDAVAALRALRPTLLCWPAGPSANHYAWQRGTGPRDERPVLSVTSGYASAFDPACNDFGPDEFLALCRELGAEPLLVLNPRLGILSIQEFLNYCNGAPGSPFGKLRAAHGHPEPYGVRYWLFGGERLADEEGAQAYPVALAELAREMRGFQPPPQLLALGGPLVADCEDDAAEARRAGPTVTHVAKGMTPEELADLEPELAVAAAEAARQLRAHSLGLALVDYGLGDGSSPAAPALGLLLNALTREGGPGAMAALRCSAQRAGAGLPATLPLAGGPQGASPEQALWQLFRAHPMAELLPAAAEPPKAGPLPFDVAAGRDGDKLILRLVRRAEREAVAHVTLEGLGTRSLAPRADDFSVPRQGADGPEPWTRADLRVQQNQLSVPFSKGQAAHLIVLRLEGGQP